MRPLFALALLLSACNSYTDHSVDDAGTGQNDAGIESPDAASQACAWSFTPAAFEPCTDVLEVSDEMVLDLDGVYIYDTDSQELINPLGTVVSHTRAIIGSGAASTSALITGSLIVESKTTLRAVGSRPLLIVSWSSITLDGVIDASSSQNEPGAGGNSTLCFPATDGLDDIGGAGAGGGGGFGRSGGSGGKGGGNGVGGGSGGIQELAAFHGGCSGGEGGDGLGADGGGGGAGGGAIFLSANNSILVGGRIHAGGGGGAGSGGSRSGGGGGGSGGFIALESQRITLFSSTILAANGGGGGSGSSTGLGTNGVAGQLNVSSATGGAAASTPNGDGGNGGALSLPPGAPGGDGLINDSGGGGGGGGSVGHIVLLTDLALGSSASVSPPAALTTPGNL